MMYDWSSLTLALEYRDFTMDAAQDLLVLIQI